LSIFATESAISLPNARPVRIYMETSFEEVLALLQKCRNENSSLTVFTSTGDSGNVIFGFISDVSPIGLIVAYNDPSSGRKIAEVMISFRRVTRFGFEDPREAPQEVRGSMSEVFDYLITMELESTTHCGIYVRKN
jgi:hypothetical protein